MNNRTQRLKFGLIGAVIVLLFGIGLTVTGTVFTVTPYQVTAEHPVNHEPIMPKTKSGMTCNVKQDDTRADFESPYKESSGSIGPRVNIIPGPQTRNYNNRLIRAVLCGDETRGANKLVYESIMTALLDPESGKPVHVSNHEWQHGRHGVKWLVEEAWLPDASHFECGVVDPPGRKTVFALDDNGLKLGITSVKPGRTSCYAHLVLSPGSVERVILARFDCELQVVTTRGRWSTIVPE